MGPYRLSGPLCARRMALLYAGLAFIAGAAVGLAVLSATPEGVTVSPGSVSAANAPAGRIWVGSSDSVANATATPVAARATATAAPPGFVLDYRAMGSDVTGRFTISGPAWKVELHCGGPHSAADITVKVGTPNAGFTADHLGYVCPAGLTGDTSAGMASALFTDTGTFALSVVTGASVAWEVIVTDHP